MASRDEIRAANKAGRAMLKSNRTAMKAHYEPKIGQVIILLNSGTQVLLDPATVQGLEKASRAQLKEIKVTGPGLGLYLPKLDVDVYLPAFLDGIHGAERWTAAELGKKGGSKKSEAKTSAARANGKLGGRPKKVAAKRAAGKRG